MAIKLAVFLSGNGTTLQNIIDRCASGELDASVVCVVSSREKAYGLERARAAGIPAIAVPRKGFKDSEALGRAIWSGVREFGRDRVGVWGWLVGGGQLFAGPRGCPWHVGVLAGSFYGRADLWDHVIHVALDSLSDLFIFVNIQRRNL